MYIHPCITCVAYSIDICTVAIEDIRNMHAVSSNPIADILRFNDNGLLSEVYNLLKTIYQKQVSMKFVFTF